MERLTWHGAHASYVPLAGERRSHKRHSPVNVDATLDNVIYGPRFNRRLANLWFWDDRDACGGDDVEAASSIDPRFPYVGVCETICDDIVFFVEMRKA